MPFKIILCGLTGLTKSEMARTYPGYTNWKFCEFHEEPLEKYHSNFGKIYLSADSDSTIDGCTFEMALIVGGLVDRNRHKVCLHF